MTTELRVINNSGESVFDIEERELRESEDIIERGLQHFLEVGRELMRIRDARLYRTTYPSFEDYLRIRWPDISKRHADRVISATKVVENLGPIGPRLPLTEGQARPLAPLSPDDQIDVWERVLEKAGSRQITAKLVEQTVAEIQAERAALAAEPEPTPEPAPAAEPAGPKPVDTSPLLSVQTVFENPPAIEGYYTLDGWAQLSADERRFVVEHAAGTSSSGFNRTNDNVEWALWTWNPVTGCNHGCDYCYARDIANRFYEDLPEGERFAPVFRPGRLWAPRRMKVPVAAAHNIGEKNVFTGSMTDLFGKWVPQDWIDAVFAEVVRAAEWNFLFLTKFPQRLAEQDWPGNAWVGTSVDRQARVATAERSFRGVTAGIKWLSCEPMLERLTFGSLEMFDWVVIGGASESSQTKEFQPPAEWVEHLVRQARTAGCQVYFKTNLKYRPREYPGQVVS